MTIFPAPSASFVGDAHNLCRRTPGPAGQRCLRHNADVTDLLNSIRSACAQVAAGARHVHLARDRLPEYAASLAPLPMPADLDPAHHYLGHADDTVAFILTLDSINFGSGYFPHLQKLPGLSGYFTVATRLTEHFQERGPFSARELQGLSPDDCARIFRQEHDDPVRLELMQLFARALNDLGHWLLERFDGAFTGPVEAAGHRAERLVALLAEMPFFRDVERYGTLDVPFYKRAQLTAADLALALPGDDWGRFDDLDRLTIFADNLVPHVLRLDGILAYEPQLLDAIRTGELVPAGSKEEIEIRAVALHAVECLAAIMRQEGRSITSMQLDYLLWNRGQQPAYKAIPRHRTRTVFY